MNIHETPHGVNVVVETGGTLYIGRYDSTNGFEVVMHDCDVHELGTDEDAEAYVRQSAKYGVAVTHKDIVFPAGGVTRVRLLGDIAQE